MEPLSVAVVGCGNIAATGHLPAYQHAAEIVTVRCVAARGLPWYTALYG